VATFFIRLASRVVVPALTALADTPRPSRTAPPPQVAARRAYDSEVRKLAALLARAA
jgi:hypothetical protein